MLVKLVKKRNKSSGQQKLSSVVKDAEDLEPFKGLVEEAINTGAAASVCPWKVHAFWPIVKAASNWRQPVARLFAIGT